jgi:hypothetical protein
MDLHKIKDKIISKLIFRDNVLTLLVKDNQKDEYASGSINFLDAIYFFDTGTVNHGIGSFEEGLLGISSREYVLTKKIDPNQFKQFYIKSVNDIGENELIVACKNVIISDDPYLFSLMK